MRLTQLVAAAKKPLAPRTGDWYGTGASLFQVRAAKWIDVLQEYSLMVATSQPGVWRSVRVFDLVALPQRYKGTLVWVSQARLPQFLAATRKASRFQAVWTLKSKNLKRSKPS